jgi:hypothetical protein
MLLQVIPCLHVLLLRWEQLRTQCLSLDHYCSIPKLRPSMHAQ